MNFPDIANRHSREQAEADPNVAMMIVHTEERLDVAAMLEARTGVEVVHQEPGLDEDTILYVVVTMNGRGRAGAGLDVFQALQAASCRLGGARDGETER
jgi:hypothetical protein